MWSAAVQYSIRVKSPPCSDIRSKGYMKSPFQAAPASALRLTDPMNIPLVCLWME
jgi:hypothetical protein